MTEKVIKIAADFSRTPAGRFPEDGAYCGENFREEHLVPALKIYDTVVVLLDGTRGYGSSFLDEAFAGLIRKSGFRKKDIESRLKVKAETLAFKRYRDIVEKYLSDADSEIADQ